MMVVNGKQCVSCGMFETGKQKAEIPCPYSCRPTFEVCPSWYCRKQSQQLPTNKGE